MAFRQIETHDAEEVVLLDHHCGYCGKTHEAKVTGRGRATLERRAPGGDSPEADARVAAQEEAAALIRLTPCPACGKRDAGEVRKLFVLALLQVVAGLALGVGAWVAFTLEAFGSRDQMRVVMIFALAGGGVVVGAIVRVATRWRGSVERVRFSSQLA
jgi:hypothetical protein